MVRKVSESSNITVDVLVLAAGFRVFMAYRPLYR